MKPFSFSEGNISLKKLITSEHYPDIEFTLQICNVRKGFGKGERVEG